MYHEELLTIQTLIVIVDVIIEGEGERLDSDFQLKISADTGRRKHQIKRSEEHTIRRASNDLM